jgi:single-stranded-DNA-specific exonuclease
MNLDLPLAGANRRFFLGVNRSICGRPWRDRLDQPGSQRALAIVQRHGIPELLARVLAARGVAPEEAAGFLDPSIRSLMPDPDSLADMPRAVVRLADAIMRGETTAVFGDYDVDGATSAAVLGRYLAYCGAPALIHIPDRLFEGYGPNPDAIRALADGGATLLVTVDCGTTSHAPLLQARTLGLDVIVIDHHQADEELACAYAVINPNRLDDLSGLGHLAAVGLVFMTVVALNRELRRRNFWTPERNEPDLLGLVDLVALGTVADVVPLKGLNRAFVAKGLLACRRRQNPGLTALMDVARLGGLPQAWHLGFLLGPRINAGGRIGRAALGVDLLMQDDPAQCAQLAGELDRLNQERQAIELATVAEADAEAMAALGTEEKVSVIVTAGERWHPGVVGLVAARLKERFGRPAFAIAFHGSGIGIGSGRSIPGVDLGRAVRRAVREGIVATGGGHAMAAGVTLERESLTGFRAYLEEMLGGDVQRARDEDALLIDGAISADGANPELVATLARAGPFGPGNPEPVVVLPGHGLVYAEEVGQAHMRARLRAADGSAIGAIAFRAAGQPLGAALASSRGQRVHAAGTLCLDQWNGTQRVQLRLLDMVPADANPASVASSPAQG